MSKKTSYIDPTTVRLSKHFLLSDLMGCNSVYTKGYPNLFVDPDGTKIREGIYLCENVLEPLLEHSRLSVSYGYISPDLSAKIVKYQDPAKPSYHRWDAGAACDVVLHDRVELGEAPIISAFWIDENLPTSRVITYSESPYICVASRVEEIRSGDHRRALYENRYIGERKPQYIAYSDNPTSRSKQKDAARRFQATSHHDWTGAGYPTYHGGGIQQMHHIRTSRYTMLSDFLFSERAVRHGLSNNPIIQSFGLFDRAGAFYDSLVELLGVRRLSIVRAHEEEEWADPPFDWKDGLYLWLVPPEGTSPSDVAQAAYSIDGVHTVGVHEDLVSVGMYYETEREKEVSPKSDTKTTSARTIKRSRSSR